VTVSYRVRQGDTLRGIAVQLLGDQALWREIARINRLRPPYISDRTVDHLGPPVTTGALPPGGLPRGGIALDMTEAIADDSVPEAVLVPGAVFYVALPSSVVTERHDALPVLRYYPTDFTEQVDAQITREWGAHTVRFRTPTVPPPAVGIALGAVPGGVLGLRAYSSRYTYAAVSGETVASPPAGGSVAAGTLATFTAPTALPAGVVAVRVYVGTPDAERLQATLTGGQTWTEPAGGLAPGAFAPLTGTAEVGASRDYPAGTPFAVFADPALRTTTVAAPGSILVLPGGAAGTPAVSEEDDLQRLFSTDVALDLRGQIALTGGPAGGDVLTVSGMPNLVQALENLLATPLGRLPAHAGWGNRLIDSVGEKFQPSFRTYAGALARECLLKDPRVEAVTAVQVRFLTSGALIVDADVDLLGETSTQVTAVRVG
jgi:phage baseplate assembly protein W